MVARAQIVGSVGDSDGPPAPMTPARLREIQTQGLPAAVDPGCAVPSGSGSPGKKPERRTSALEAETEEAVAAAADGDARPGRPARQASSALESNDDDVDAAGAKSPDVYGESNRSRRRSLQQGPTNAESEVLCAADTARRLSNVDLASASRRPAPRRGEGAAITRRIGTPRPRSTSPTGACRRSRRRSWARTAATASSRAILRRAPWPRSTRTAASSSSRPHVGVPQRDGAPLAKKTRQGTAASRGARSSRSSTATASTATSCRSTA